MNKKKQLTNLVSVRGADALRRVKDSLEKQGFSPVPMPDDFGHRSNGNGNDHRWEEYIHAKLMCGEQGRPGRGIPTVHLSSGGEVMTPDNIGTKGLGYMAWGVSNQNPNIVSHLREASPYTASAHRFNVDLCEGKGPRPVYAYTQYVGGNITEKRVAFKDAGILLKGWIRDLKRELANLTAASPVPGGSAAGNPATTSPVPGGSAAGNNALIADIQEQISTLEQDYAKWQQTNDELTNFLMRNNLHLSYLSLVEDMQDQNLCFPEITLNKRTLGEDGKNLPTSMWTPKITGLRYRSAHTCRLERKDQNGRINYVYVSNQWLDSPNHIYAPEDQKITAKPALDPQAPLTDLQRIVRETRQANGSIRRRPTQFILPIAYPSAGRPYYPIPAWQSIFSGDIYEYLMTMVSDRNRRRQNSNVIGRILYLNNEYMERLYFQNKADTPADKTQVFNKLRNQINSFLEDRDNTGKPMVAYTFQSQADGKTYESWKIVEIEANNKSTAEANQKELAEISSIIFFAFGLDSHLVGNTPGDTSSRSGTDLRERYLLKQVQMSPMQQLLLLPLYLIKYFNGYDDHLEWEIPREVLTTLDNSKTGITNAEQPT